MILPEITKPKSLLDVMPDPTANNGVFDYLTSMVFIEPEHNNIEYLYNRSGDKLPSPLVSRLADDDTLTQVSLQSLARIILARFRYKWQRIWDEYSSSNPLWNTLDITETKSGTEASSDVTNDSSYLSRSNSKEYEKGTIDTTILTGSHEDVTAASDTSTSTRSGSVSEAEGGSTTEVKSTSGQSVSRTQHEGTIGDVSSTAGNTSIWGFNSAVAVKQTAENASDGSVRTYDNTDTTTEEPAMQDTRAVAHGRTNTTSYDNYKDGISSNTTGSTTRKFNDETSTTTHSGSDTTSTIGSETGNKSSSKSGTSYSSMSTHTTGFDIRYLRDKTEMLKLLYTDPSFNNFWEVIYSDIDEVLTCPIFV